MEILIVGAGVAGLTLAFWLKQYGFQPVVVEKAPTIRTEGYMLDFAGTGWDVANRMGLMPALRAVDQGLDGFLYRTQTRAVPIRVRDLFKSARMENKYLALNRRDLVRVLYEAVKENVDVRFGLTVNALTQSAESVAVRFSDGSQHDFELVIGGDGIHSQVRQLVFGDEHMFSHYMGYQFAIFTVPALKPFPDRFFQLYLEPDHQAGIYPTSEGNWLVYLVYRNEDGRVPPPQERAAFLQERFQGLHWIVPDIMQALTDESYIFLDNVTQIQMPAWVNNRVALIGDAACCPTLISGQGASMAMAGAYFLAQEFTKTHTYGPAFAAYEADLRPVMDKIQRKARNFAPNFVPKKQWQITLISWLMQMMGLPFVRSMVGKQFSVESILEDVPE